MVERGYVIRCGNCGHAERFMPGFWHETAQKLARFPVHCDRRMELIRMLECQVCGEKVDELVATS
jgi:hypothetical protein